MNELWVRDHSQPCEHDELDGHFYDDWTQNIDGFPDHRSRWCHGGREMVLEGVRKKCFEPERYDAETVFYVEVPDE